MKCKFLNAAFLLAFVISCQNNNQVETLSTFDEFLEAYYLQKLSLNPLEATYSGIPGYDDQFPNYGSEDDLGKRKAFYSSILEQLNSYDRNGLNESDQVSYDILKWECEVTLEEMDFPTHLMPIDQMWSPHLSIAQFASGSSAQPFRTVTDYHNWLKRVDGYIIWSDTSIANMRKGIENGYVLPVSLIKKVIPQMVSMTSDDTENHIFFQPVKNFPDSFSESEKIELTSAYRNMVENKIVPAFARMAGFLENEYLPNGRESSGYSALNGGTSYYQTQIKYFTTTNMTSDEIFELGKLEVTRIHSEMEKVKTQVGYKGDLKSFFEYVRNKRELMPYDDPQQVIDNFNAIHERMKPNLEKLFDLVPKAGFEVRQTEAFREASASAEYNQPAKDGSRPGIFYVPIPDVMQYNVFSDESLFLHEAIPGHHYQISLQQENDSLPAFRQTLWYSAYGEGWALYCESLGRELGLYTDPYQYFGMLGAEIHRAIRLVVDAGIHTQGWTREQAIQYSLDNEAEGEASIISEIERYMAKPGQALSYKIGQLKIMALREQANKALGDDFDIREFHNIVLGTGCIPLELLERKIGQWIDSKKS